MTLRFKAKKFTLVTEKRRLPNGYTASVDMILHPGAALIVPYLTQDKIVFIRQYRPVFKTCLYELPAGTLNPKEQPLACAKRELTEETGFAAKNIRLKGRIYPVPGYSDEVIFIFKATGMYKKDGVGDADEIIEVFPLTVNEIRRLFRSDKIFDAKTICALALCGVL